MTVTFGMQCARCFARVYYFMTISYRFRKILTDITSGQRTTFKGSSFSFSNICIKIISKYNYF
jgi:hypothetical protein